MKVKANYITQGNIYYQSNPTMFMQLVSLVENYPCSYCQMLRAKGKKSFVAHHPEYVPPYKVLYDWITTSLPLLSDPFYKLSTKCYWILNGLTEFPKCAYHSCTKVFTNVNVMFNQGGYQKFCFKHSKCDPTTIAKRKATCRKNHGVDAPMQSKEIQEKAKQTNIKNLGCEWPLQSQECIEKGKQTRFQEHGDRNWSNHEQTEKTFRKHLEDNPNFVKDIRAKVHQTNIENGHPENWTNRKQAKETRLQNHDGQYWTDEMVKKRDQTIDRNRKLNPNYDYEIRERIEETSMMNYGVPCTFQSEPVQKKLKEWIISYGGETNSFQTEYVKEKSRKKMQANYGVDYALQSDEIKARIDFKQIVAKGNETKKTNGTFNISKLEERAYELLCKHFNESNIIRQYKSEEYPFNCDFYIKTTNTYIECNFTWTHNDHFFF